jgi:hypothetical protein
LEDVTPDPAMMGISTLLATSAKLNASKYKYANNTKWGSV